MTDSAMTRWGEFSEQGDERRYWAHHRASLLQHLRTSVAVGSILFAVAGVGDIFVWEVSALLAVGLALRTMALLWGALVVARLTDAAMTWERASCWVLSWEMIISAALLGNIWLTQVVVMSHVLGLVAFILGMWLFVPIKGRHSTLSSAVLAGVGVAVLWDIGLTDPEELINASVILVGVALLSGLQARRVATLGRQAFLAAEELTRLATTDSLTGVLNRRSVVAEGDAMASQGDPVVVCVFDLDHFKSINDSHGHPAGDEVLRTFARLVESHLNPEAAFFGRIGGEEFMVLVRSDDPDVVWEQLDALRRQVEAQRLVFQGRSIRFTTSVGVSTVEVGESSIGDAMRRADLALYRAKSEGRNRVVAAFAQAIEFDELSSASRRRSQWFVRDHS